MSLTSSFSPPFPSLGHVLSCCVLGGMYPQASSGGLDVVMLMAPVSLRVVYTMRVVQLQDIFSTKLLEWGHGQSRPCRWRRGRPRKKDLRGVVYNREKEGRDQFLCICLLVFVFVFTQCILIFLQQPWCMGTLLPFLAAAKLWCL